MSNFVPEGWTINQLGKLTDVRSSNVDKKTDDAEIPVRLCNYMDVYRNNRITSEIEFMEATAKQGEIDRFSLEKGDVIITKDSETPDDIAVSAYVSESFTGVVCGYHLTLLRPHSNLANGQFLSHLFQLQSVQHYFYLLANGTTRFGLTADAINAAPLLTPPLPEQQKIATILSSVDDVIEKTRVQIDKLKDLKTGMMQELLTKGIGHTEFKDSPVGRIPVEWDVVHLESLVSIMESGWSPQCDSVPAKGCEWAVLKTTAVSWDGFDFTANKKLPDELEPRPKIQVEVHDILITRAGPAERVGVVSYVEHVPRRIMLSDKLIRIKAHHNQNPQFLSFWLSTEFVRNYFSQRTTGLAQSQTNISQDILKSLLCVVPPLAEQETISSTISALEKQLMTKRNILSHYEKMKKALMQDLLAGKVRVKLNESAVQ